MDAREVVQAVLGAEPGADEHYASRVQGKRVQLANVDRAAPPPATAMLARQARRAERRARRAQHRAAAPSSRETRAPPRPRVLPYTQAEPLHALWLQYVQDLVSLPELAAGAEPEKALAQAVSGASQMQTMQNTLLKADWTGAKLSVVQSTNPALVRLCGIVVQETHETFLLVPENEERVRMVPKQNTVFRVVIPATRAPDAPRLTLDLFGNQMRYTLPARATRKHKARKTVELG